MSLFKRKSHPKVAPRRPYPSPEELQAALRLVVREQWDAPVPRGTEWLYIAELQRQIDELRERP